MIAIALLAFLGCRETCSCQLKFKREDEQFTSAESADGRFEYRIKNLNVQHERVAKERELKGR